MDELTCETVTMTHVILGLTFIRAACPSVAVLWLVFRDMIVGCNYIPKNRLKTWGWII